MAGEQFFISRGLQYVDGIDTLPPEQRKKRLLVIRDELKDLGFEVVDEENEGGFAFNEGKRVPVAQLYREVLNTALAKIS